MDAFLLAAGRGERLRPVTDTIPKPLLKVGNRTLIEHHLDALGKADFHRVIINLAWLGEKISDYLGDGSRYGLDIEYSIEAEGALETAGGIINALHLIKSGTVAVISADSWSSIDYATLSCAPGIDMNLVMVANPDHHPGGDFSVLGNRLVFTRPGMNAYTYSGVGCFSRGIFEALKPGRRPLRPMIESAIQQKRAGATVHTGRWMDIGTLERLEQANTAYV